MKDKKTVENVNQFYKEYFNQPTYVKVKIEPHFAGDYRIEYDSKYITLFGKNKNYEGFRFNESDPIWYEEMVLDSCVLEIRNANPEISCITNEEIIITLNVNESEDTTA